MTIHNKCFSIHNFLQKTNNRSLALPLVLKYTANTPTAVPRTFSNNGCHVCKRGELKDSEMVPLPLGTRLTPGDGSGDRVPVKPSDRIR